MRLKFTPLARIAMISERAASLEVKKMTAIKTMSGKIIEIIKGTNP
jgi:hypothetical protein